MLCQYCNCDDLSLVDYIKIVNDIDVDYYEVTFECRQCYKQFTVNLSEDELNNYR